jgi:type I restriction enzyme S subunit
VLDEADQIRHDRREAIGLLDELARSSYLDLVESASRSGTVHDLVESAAYGTSARTNAPPGGTNAVPIIRVSDITGDGELDVTHLNTAELDARELAKYSVQEGDVLFSRTASAESVSKTTILRGDLVAAHAAQVVRLRPRHTASAEYLAFFLNRAHTKESLRALGTINPTNLLLVSVPLPSFDAQALFAQQLRDIASVKANELAQLARLDELYAALQNRAFSGRL